MQKKVIAGVVMVLILGLAGAAWAGSGNGWKDWHGRHWCTNGHHWCMKHGPMSALNRLDLTAHQWNQVAAILGKHKNEIKTLRHKMWKDRKALHEAVHADTFNEQKIRAASRALSANMEKMAVLRGKMLSEIRGVLTPKQIERMKNMREINRARMKAFWEYDELMQGCMMQGPMMHHGPIMRHGRMMHGGMLQE